MTWIGSDRTVTHPGLQPADYVALYSDCITPPTDTGRAQKVSALATHLIRNPLVHTFPNDCYDVGLFCGYQSGTQNLFSQIYRYFEKSSRSMG